MARLYREAPLNGIWEGTGNVVCLDVLRSIRRYPDCVPALLDELRAARGSDPRYDAFLAELETDLVDVLRHEHLARRFVERMALGLSASLLIRHAPPAVADAYVASRLAADASALFARNLYNFLSAFWDKEAGRPVLPDGDEIGEAIRLTRGGEVVNKRLLG